MHSGHWAYGDSTQGEIVASFKPSLVDHQAIADLVEVDSQSTILVIVQSLPVN